MSGNETVQDKNLKFKGVFLNNNNENDTKLENINSFLHKETIQNKTKTWNKLDKTGKIRLLTNYVDDIMSSEHNLSADEIKSAKHYLIDSLDKTKLQHVKDVQCDKTTGTILAIPTLQFNLATRKFTLKRSEKRTSTLKSLGKGKKPTISTEETTSILCQE